MSATPRKLHPVAGPSRGRTVSEAVASGTTRDVLVALRERVARAVTDEGTHPRDLAPLTRRLQDIVKELELLDLRDAEDMGRGSTAPDAPWDAETI